MNLENFVRASGQDRFNVLLMLIYIVNIAFSGISLLTGLIDLNEHFLAPFVVLMMAIAMVSYPAYIIARWVKHKVENKLDNTM